MDTKKLYLLHLSLIILLSILWNIISVSAQISKGFLNGTVKSASGKPLEFVHAGLKGTHYGGTTNAKGEFKFSAPAGSYLLVVSSIGFKSTEIPVTIISTTLTNMGDIIIEENAKQLQEVVIEGKTDSQQLRESVKAIEVLDTKDVSFKSVDMGEVLAQSKGVSVRRNGGLGSEARFSLNGLTDDQIRFFLNGLPLSYSGYSFGFANIPVNAIERIEIYKGVLPIQFGADALGGAVNIVTPGYLPGLHGGLSYQVGAFGTHRVSADVQYLNDSTGFFMGVSSFLDRAKNDYKVTIDLADDKGRIIPTGVRRFHDSYHAKGLNVEVGLQNKRWAKKISLVLFHSDFTKQQQNNNIMTVPYGGVQYGKNTQGATLTYLQGFSRKLNMSLMTGYTHSAILFSDTSAYVYNWLGQVVANRTDPGEIGHATDQTVWENASFARLNFEYLLGAHHTLKASLAPTYVYRTGQEERLLDSSGRDPLSAKNYLTSLVNGLEYESHFIDTRLQNALFLKQYSQNLKAEDVLPGNIFSHKERKATYYGFGDMLRFSISERIGIKTSYEWTTRLPTADEVFGDGGLTLKNLNLKPERSHNANVEVDLKNKATSNTKWRVSLNGFLREVINQIVLLGDDNLFKYQNVFAARSVGIEFGTNWNLFKEKLNLDANLTYQSFRNTSTEGSYALYDGDRIPNRPYLFSNAGAQYRCTNPFKANHELIFFWSARYIHSFYRGWESAGLKSSKQVIDAQIVNNLGATYSLPFHRVRTSLTTEVQNLANSKLYDNFGVQKPGRAFYLKLTSKF